MKINMKWLIPLFGIAVAWSSQSAFAKSCFPAPIKIARECKSEAELFF